MVIAPRGEFSPGALGLKSLKKRVYLLVAKALGLYRGVVWQASSEHEEADILQLFGRGVPIVVAPNLPPVIHSADELPPKSKKTAGCRKLIGFELPKPAKIIVNNGLKTPVYPQEVHRLMSLLVPLGIKRTDVDFCLPTKAKDKRAVDTIWQDYGLTDKNPIVAICPGAKFSNKRWSVGGFAEVISRLQRQFSAKIVLIGGSSEKTFGEEIVKRAKNSVVNLIGKTNYMDLQKLSPAAIF